MSDPLTQSVQCSSIPLCYDFTGKIAPQIYSNYVISNSTSITNGGCCTITDNGGSQCCIPCTEFPITGTGETNNCLRISNGTNTGDIIQWDGTTWIITQLTPTPINTNFPITGNGSIGNPIDLTPGNAPNTFLAWHPLPVSVDEWAVYRSPVGIVDIIVGDPSDRRTHFSSLAAALAATPTAETRAIRIINNITENAPLTFPSTLFLHIDSEVSVTFDVSPTVTGNFYIYGRSPQSTVIFNQGLTTPIGSTFSAEQVSLQFSGAQSVFNGPVFFRQSRTTITIFETLIFNDECTIEDVSIVKDPSLSSIDLAMQFFGTNNKLSHVNFTLSTSNGFEFQGKTHIEQLTITSLANTVIGTVFISVGAEGSVINDVTLLGLYPTANGLPANNFIFNVSGISDITITGFRYGFNNPGNAVISRLGGVCKNVKQITGTNRMYIAMLAPSTTLEDAIVHTLTTDGSASMNGCTLNQVTIFDTVQIDGVNPAFMNAITIGSNGLLSQAQNKFLTNIRCPGFSFSLLDNCTNNYVVDVQCTTCNVSGINIFDNTLSNIRCSTLFNYVGLGAGGRNNLNNIYSAGAISVQNFFTGSMCGLVARGNIFVTATTYSIVSNIASESTVTLASSGASSISDVAAQFILVQTSTHTLYSNLSVGGPSTVPAPNITVANTVNNCSFSNLVACTFSPNQNIDCNIFLNCNSCSFSNISGGQVNGRSYDLFVTGNNNTFSNISIPGTQSDELLTFQVTGNNNKFANVNLGTETVPFGRTQNGTAAGNHLFQVGNPGGNGGVGNQFTNLYMYPMADRNAPVQRVWVLIGDSSTPNSLTNGAFNQFTDCIFYRSNDAAYAPTVSIPPVAGSSSQPLYVFGRHNTFTNVRMGPETEGAALTDSHIDFSTILAPLNGVVRDLLLPTGNANVNGAVLNVDGTFTY